MKLSAFSELFTHRLCLRKPAQSDWQTILFMRSDPSVNKYINREPAKSKEEALDFIQKRTEDAERSFAFYWVITTRDLNEMIGSICLWNFSEDKLKAELGYDLHPDFQGKGIMDEALKSVVNFGFNRLNVNLIDAYTHRENIPSRRLLERNQFIFCPEKTDDGNPDNVIYEYRKS